MGNQNNHSNTGNRICLEHYHPTKQYQLPWTGSFTLLQADGTLKPKKIIEKKLRLYNGAEAKELIVRFKDQAVMPFYLIKPLHIELDEKDIICADSSSVIIYHADFLPTLEQRMHEDSSNLSKEVSIWFLLNEIVHGLQVLYEKGIAHLWVSPDTMFLNENANWLLQDMSFWWGYDLQSKKMSKAQFRPDPKKTLRKKSNHIPLHEISCPEQAYNRPRISQRLRCLLFRLHSSFYHDFHPFRSPFRS